MSERPVIDGGDPKDPRDPKAPEAPDAPEKVLSDYREKAAQPGLRPVLDSGDEGDVKNAYLDYVHRVTLNRWIERLGPRVVDLGCGLGRLLDLVTDRPVSIGLDASPELLQLARERLGPRARLARADLAQLPLLSGSLTGAMMCFVSLHFDDDTLDAALSEVERVLQPGGVFLYFEHIAPGDEPRLYHGVVDRPMQALLDALDRAGFDLDARIGAKKTPSRSVHWVRNGKLPRWLWWFGAWFDRKTASRRLEHADYVEGLLVARKRGGRVIPELPTAREMTTSLFWPQAWGRKRKLPPRKR